MTQANYKIFQFNLLIMVPLDSYTVFYGSTWVQMQAACDKNKRMCISALHSSLCVLWSGHHNFLIILKSMCLLWC